MKRLLSAVFALVAVLCVIMTAVACGEEQTPETTADTQASNNTEDTSASQPETKATESEQVTEPTVTEPPVTEPPATEPTVTEPTVTEPTVTEPPVTEPPETIPDTETTSGFLYEYKKAEDYADLDFGGKTFNIIYRWEPESLKPSGYGVIYDLYEDPDNPDDMMTAAVAFRRNTMKLYYNCEVVGIPSLSASGEASTAIDSGDAKYDLVIAAYSINSYNQGTRYYNLMAMMNLDYDCWDKAIIRDLAFGGKIYGMTGDITTTDEDYTFVMFFNKDMLKENNQPDPYQLVREGKWTIEKFFEIERSCAKELDGEDGMSARDQFGYVARADTWRYFFYGAGARFVTPIQDDGSVKWAANSLGYESDIYQYAINIFSDESFGGAAFSASNIVKLGAPDGIRETFGSGHAAFYTEGLYNIHYEEITTGLRDYEDLHFGILPAPKWNEDQTDYYSYVWEQGGFVGVPSTCNFKIASDFLNVYALASQATVQKAYLYSIAYSYASDPNVADMLDIIINNRVWCASLWIEKTVDASLCSDVGMLKNRFAKKLTSGQDKILKAIEQTIETNKNNPN